MTAFWAVEIQHGLTLFLGQAHRHHRVWACGALRLTGLGCYGHGPFIGQPEPGRARGTISPLAVVSGPACPLPAFSPELDSLAESASGPVVAL